MEQLGLWRPEVHGFSAMPNPAAPHACPGMNNLPAAALWFAGQAHTPVRLTFTDNHATMISYRYTDHGLRLRLHRMFRAAGSQELTALAAFVLRGDKQAGRLLDKFMAKQAAQLPLLLPPRVVTRGRVHNLEAIFAELNARYFHNACAAAITWEPAHKATRRTTRVWARYQPQLKLIYVHAMLDHPDVPAFYVAWVVFQAMLRELFEPTAGARNRSLPPEYHIIVAGYHDFARCRAWEQENAPRLHKAPRWRLVGSRRFPRSDPSAST